MTRTLWLIVSVLILLCAPAELHAQFRSVTITYLKGGNIVVKSIVCKGSVPGTGQNQKFQSFKKKIKQLRAKGVAGRRLKELQSMQSSGRTACMNSNIPPVVNGNFDGFGNITAAGKRLFQIPSQFSVNISDGRAIHESMCSGCHGERINYTFPVIRYRTSLSPMLFTPEELSDLDVARLTAFYNRFRP